MYRNILNPQIWKVFKVRLLKLYRCDPFIEKNDL